MSFSLTDEADTIGALESFAFDLTADCSGDTVAIVAVPVVEAGVR